MKKIFEVSATFEVSKLNKNDKAFPTSLLNYILTYSTCLGPYVLSCLIFRVTSMLSCLTFLFHYVVPSFIYLVPYILSCLTCLLVYLASCLTYSVSCMLSWLMCSCASRALVPYMPLVPFVLRISSANINFCAFVLISHSHVLNCFHVNFYQIYFQLVSCSGKFSAVKIKIACMLLIEIIVSINQQYDLVKPFSEKKICYLYWYRVFQDIFSYVCNQSNWFSVKLHFSKSL